MKVHLPYGRTGLEIEVPDDAHVLVPKRIPAVADPPAAIRQALRQPIASRPLRELVRPNDTIAVVFSDITRPAPNHVILPALLAELAEAGVPRQAITLINGLGMHRPNTPQELAMMLGDDIVASYRIVQHDAHDRLQLTHLFDNERGARVEVNSHYMQANVKILTGFVEPHIFAGYSGGGKAVLPAIAGADIVMSNHSGPMIAHEKSTWCSVDGNPIFQEMRKVALATRPTMLLNVTLNQRKEITGIFAGELTAAHDAGIAFAQRAYLRPIAHEFDVAVVGNLGYPSDINLYQSLKGLSVAAQGVRPGGAVILAAECADGLGLPQFQQLLRERSSPQGLLEMICDPSFRAYDQWGVQVGAMAEVKVDGYLYSSLTNEETQQAHLRPCADLNDTIAALCDRNRSSNGGSEPRVLVLPYGQLTVPRVEAKATSRD